jgi:hypothetical protein
VSKKEEKILKYLSDKKHLVLNRFTLEAIIQHAKRQGFLVNFKVEEE